MAGNAGSLQGTAQTFDLNSQGGVMSVLKAIRHSSLPLAEQNELRDLIFLYTNGGGDPETKKQLEERLASIDLTPAPDTKAAEGAPAADAPVSAHEPSGVGQSRPTPKFSQPAPAAGKSPSAPEPAETAASQPAAAPTPPPQTAPEPTTPPPAQPQQQPAAPAQTPAQPAPQPAPEKTADTPSPQPAPEPATPPPATSTPPPQPAPEPATPPPAQSQPPEPQQPAAPEQAAPPVQPAPAAPQGGGPDHLARVREIKLEVNKLVGNPVNLVDINNEVGREYMTSLLEAMKKLNGGQPVEVEQAMSRLEKAFTSVKEAVANAPAGTKKPMTEKQAAASPDPREVPNQAAPPAPPQPTPPASAAPQPPAPEPAPAPTPPAQPPTPPPSSPQGSDAASTPPPADFKQPGSLKSLADEVRLKRSGEEGGSSSWKAPQPSSPSQPQSEPQSPPTPPAPPTPKPTPAPPAQPEPPQQSSGLAARIAALTGNKEEASTPAPPPTPPNAPAAASSPESVAPPSAAPTPPTAPEPQKTTAQTPEKKTEPAAGKAIDPNDPLMSPEITSGLDQLLSEWNLFKSSGLFGTGPNGREHPLFQKLKNLSITNILAGRYDGAKPEIKQSITDYMNGWRYEQGVIYEPGETFEHYLRRVIKHILDSKNQ